MAVLLHIGAAGNVNPVGGFTVLPDELVEGGVIHDPGEPFPALGHGVDADIGGLAQQMLG